MCNNCQPQNVAFAFQVVFSDIKQDFCSMERYVCKAYLQKTKRENAQESHKKKNICLLRTSEVNLNLT